MAGATRAGLVLLPGGARRLRPVPAGDDAPGELGTWLRATTDGAAAVDEAGRVVRRARLDVLAGDEDAAADRLARVAAHLAAVSAALGEAAHALAELAEEIDPEHDDDEPERGA